MAQITGRRYTARVVCSESGIVVAVSVEELDKAIPIIGALGSVNDHLPDCRDGCERVEGDAIMGLHDSRVCDAVVGGRNSQAATRLLHDNSQDGTVVNSRCSGDLLDIILDPVDLAVSVIWTPSIPSAALLHKWSIGLKHCIERNPLATVWEACWSASVVYVFWVDSRWAIEHICIVPVRAVISDLGDSTSSSLELFPFMLGRLSLSQVHIHRECSATAQQKQARKDKSEDSWCREQHIDAVDIYI